MCVTSIAIAASPFAASALPPLKPNQPTHNIPAPATVNVMLCGNIGCDGKPRRGPIVSAAVNAATPAVKCTTMPPAKSSTPIDCSQPPPHTQCATGMYTTSSHNAENSTHAENRIRSAKPPITSAGVMIANVSWNNANAVSGTAPCTVS